MKEKQMQISKKMILATSVFFSLLLAAAFSNAKPPWMEDGEMPWQKHKREKQDAIGGVPDAILKKQSTEAVEPPSIEDAVKTALAAAREAATPLIDLNFHKGRKIFVPDDFPAIQAAIDSAKSGDSIIVRPGVYYELLVMKDGVKLTSDASDGGETLSDVAGARLKLPKRALRTIVDGSKSEPSTHGMVDFNPGVGRNTIIDGFIFRNLPEQNHHIPGHAHGINVRGASPIIMNCLIENTGSTGIGNHVVYEDQEHPIGGRDFRWANIKHKTSAVIYSNIIRGNLGLGVGCNHFAAPFILGNEIYNNNDSDLGGEPTPGIGSKHGSTPTIIGNIVHNNPGGGILSSPGDRQGAHPIDKPTQPTIISNVVYENGNFRPAISNAGGGSEASPVVIKGNFVYKAPTVGIALSKGATGVIENNLVAESEQPGIVIHASTVAKLNGNKVTKANSAGILIAEGSPATRPIKTQGRASCWKKARLKV